MKRKPRLGIQGPVVAWQDPWGKEASDSVMRTGTGSVCPSQDPRPEPQAFIRALQELQADFYVHHALPGMQGYKELLEDVAGAGLDICLGNEYGNINGPWVEGTNRYDLPDDALAQAAASGRCIGLLYDEPEHLQINAAQYRKDGWFPHWGLTDGETLERSRLGVESAVRGRVRHVGDAMNRAGRNPGAMPLISEQVFPTSFHTYARAGMELCPKIMKESFQSLQLSTALGAAKQYGRNMWICADLWGPDTGAWFTRFHGFPGHSPEEFASALRMGYWMGPSHLFVENADVLLRSTGEGFTKTEFGEVWLEFVKSYVPGHPLRWHHSQADPDIVIIHSDDSNYGQNERLFGNRSSDQESIARSQSVFTIWHLLSRGRIPAYGSCMHIPGYDFPRHELKREVSIERFPLEKGYIGSGRKPIHPLLYPVHNVLVYDGYVTGRQLGRPKLIMAGGSDLSDATFQALRQKAEDGAVVVIADWLLPKDCPADVRISGAKGLGQWLVTDDFLSENVREAVQPFLGDADCWMQRFGKEEVRMYARNEDGSELDFEIRST
ncbi:hypothetical protein N0M98_06405 [Paenibacillus doosanensis]|nr:hypothetical protein [Paenibacillus konkukensis]MCS7459769.1 hypothetical protein [Paenibacillus doosanensis]